MLTDPKLRSQVDQLWDKLWAGGLSNPLNAIEQLSYLLFLKRLDDAETRREVRAKWEGTPFTPTLPHEMRWSTWTYQPAEMMLQHLKTKVFPWLTTLGSTGSSFSEYMKDAVCLIAKPSLLVEACNLIDQMEISAQNQDVQGDLYEYLLSRLNTSGTNGQFRTPRHIIRMMVKMIAPQPSERIGDLAAGTCGFLVNAYQYILEQHTSPNLLKYDEAGEPHRLVGDLLTDEQQEFLQQHALKGYDNDSGLTMLRIGSMNLMLHGIDSPRFFYQDTLSKAYTEKRAYDVILMNPPFKGAIDKGDVSPSLPSTTTKTELLFLHLILRVLDMGGRCAVIVPDGVLFGSSNAHVEVRKALIELNGLDGVISMPSGVFKPYAGVSTAVLLFTRGAKTERIWFYDMAHDGFSLDDKRVPTPIDNDIPDILHCWEQRHNDAFDAERQARVAQLQTQVAPLKAERLKLQAEVNRLTFEHAIAADGDEQTLALMEADKSKLADLEKQIAPLQKEIDGLTRQFWVTKQQVVANKYDLSASRYHQVEQDETYYEDPKVTMERLLKLERVMADTVRGLSELVG
ncbi:MAG: SAM-dependent DNA methyltransferase [Herpetosiphonaceae bacterium]|nr:SAM-dependent DNA methyltransferase [Herpetosiphonaceae bacterium]